MNIGLVIQARMGSTRLPGKVLMPLRGVPVLLRIITQLKSLPNSYKRIVITSTSQKDDVIEEFCKRYHVYCFRGSEEDVLDRYYNAAKKFKLDHIVRLTGDNPCIDPFYITSIITAHVLGDFDYSSNKSESHSGLPIGIGCEIFSRNALERCWLSGKSPNHREHINEFILENLYSFRTSFPKKISRDKFSSLRLTLDTPKDFIFLERIITLLEEKGLDISLKNIITLSQEDLL